MVPLGIFGGSVWLGSPNPNPFPGQIRNFSIPLFESPGNLPGLISDFGDKCFLTEVNFCYDTSCFLSVCQDHSHDEHASFKLKAFGKDMVVDVHLNK